MPLARRRPSRAELAVNRRMFLKAAALGMSVPAAMRLARMATAATTAPPKRFFLMYIPHGTAPEHFNPKVNEPGSEGAGELQRLRAGSDQRQHPGRRCSRTSRTSTSTRGSSTRAPPQRTPASSTACRAPPASTRRRARTTVEHVIAKALNVKPLILGACSHITNGLDTNGMLFWNGTPIDPREEPGQGVRRAVWRPDDRRRRSTPTCSCARTCSRSRRPRCRACRRRCRA